MVAALRRIVWRPGSTALAGLAAGIVATALVVHWTDPFAKGTASAARVPPALRTISLGWSETQKIEDASGQLVFQAATFSLNKDGSWTVSASIRNSTTKRVAVSVEEDKGPGARPGLTSPVEPLPAATITPSLPSKLWPGETWSGWFVGRQKVPRGQPLHVAFGYFRPSGESGFGRLSRRTFVLRR
jgi:hypothetical protein